MPSLPARLREHHGKEEDGEEGCEPLSPGPDSTGASRPQKLWLCTQDLRKTEPTHGLAWMAGGGGNLSPPPSEELIVPRDGGGCSVFFKVAPSKLSMIQQISPHPCTYKAPELNPGYI